MTIRRISSQRVSQQRNTLSQKVDLPAPVGGLNTRDNRGDMEITDAIILQNWIPANEAVTSRDGYSVWADDVSGEVESLMPYISGTTSQLLAASDGNIYELDTIASGTSTSIASGKTNARWQHVNFNSYLLICNGEDAPLGWDGSSFTTLTYSGDLNTYGEEKMDGIHAHKNRVYMWDTDTSNFYYGGTDAIQGAFSVFPLGVVSDTGGNLIIMQTISFDSGFGVDDLAVFILSTGETLLYQGSDPSDASNWSLVGKYMLPPPLSVRSAVKFGGDVKVITQADAISIMEFIRSEGTQTATKRLSKISGSIKTESALNKSKYGWQAIWHSAIDLIIYNVPNTEGETYVQYVTNTSTGASSKFTGWNARCFALWNNELYFGGDTFVYKAFDTDSDNGSDISLIAQPAFTTLGISRDKRIIGHEQLLGSDGNIDVGLSIAFNYGDTSTPSTSSSPVSGALWDVTYWDTAQWSGAGEVRIKRFLITGTGLSVSAKTNIKISGQTLTWYRSTYIFDVMATR